MRIVFVRLLEEIEDTKKTFQNELTFKVIEIRCVLEHSADIRTIEKELDVSKHTYNFMHVVYSKQPSQKVEHSWPPF